MNLNNHKILAIGVGLSLGCCAHASNPHDIFTFKEINDHKLQVRVQLPDGNSREQPCIIFYHAGGWTGGKPVKFDQQASYFIERGYVIIQPSYRLLSKNPDANGQWESPKVCIEDARSAYRWVAENAENLRIDPKKIIVAGASVGGHLAAAISLIDDHNDQNDNLSIPIEPAAMILINPVIYLCPDNYGYKRVQSNYSLYSPYNHVSRKAPPTLILSGSEDRHIPPKLLWEFGEDYTSYGVTCEIFIYEGMPHSFYAPATGGKEAYDEVIYQIDRFSCSLGIITGKPTMKQPQGMTLTTKQ